MDYIPKVWGSERIIVNNDLYCGKILTFIRGHRASFHYHKSKKETFYVRKGKILMLYAHLSAVESTSPVVIGEMIKRAETFTYMTKNGVLSAIPQIDYIYLNEGDTFQVDPYLVHQAIAIYDSEILEFSTHSEDSDSYRIVVGG